MDELTKDMCNLAKMIWDLSKKHGGLFIRTACIGADTQTKHSSSTVHIDNKTMNIEYWANTNEYTRNATENIEFEGVCQYGFTKNDY